MSNQASTWVRRFASLIPDGEVLDLACGGGRHSLLLASMGYHVLAVDRDLDLLSTVSSAVGGSHLTTLQFDLENDAVDTPVWPFESDRFSGIVVTNYLHRPLFPYIAASLAPNGVLIYETFAKGNEHFGKPSNPDFLLSSGELLNVAAMHSLRVIAFEDGYAESPKPSMVQRICAVKVGADFFISNLRLI